MSRLTLDKLTLCDKVSKRTGIPRYKIEIVVNLFLEELKVSLDRGEKLNIKNFGIFESVEQKPKKIINVVTNEEVVYDRRKFPRFRLDPKLSKFIHKYIDLLATFGE